MTVGLLGALRVDCMRSAEQHQTLWGANCGWFPCLALGPRLGWAPTGRLLPWEAPHT